MGAPISRGIPPWPPPRLISAPPIPAPERGPRPSTRVEPAPIRWLRRWGFRWLHVFDAVFLYSAMVCITLARFGTGWPTYPRNHYFVGFAIATGIHLVVLYFGGAYDRELRLGLRPWLPRLAKLTFLAVLLDAAAALLTERYLMLAPMPTALRWASLGATAVAAGAMAATILEPPGWYWAWAVAILAVVPATPEDCHNALSVRDRFRRGAFSTVLMHARADAKLADSDRDVKGEMGRAGMGPALIAAMVSKLRKTVERLTWSKSSTTWSDYSDRAHYADDDLQLKSEFVAKVAAASPRKLAWDVGANDAHFSRIAAEHAEYVVAFDVDPLVVDRTYRTLRDEGERRIQPMLMNLADPSPGLGWRGLERPTLLGRGGPDLVLCLAVIHHLAITNTVPLAGFVEWLAEVGSETVVEFPTRDDPMVKILLRNKRAGLFDGYNLDAFEKLLAERFDILTREELPSGTRVLFHAKPRH